MKSKKSLGIIGAGTVGMTLAVLAQRSGCYNVTVGSRHPQRAASLLAEFGFTGEVVLASQAARCDVVMLTVPDSHIRTVCESLVELFRAGNVVMHCSGALTSDELSSAGHCSVASVHPLQTFPGVAESLAQVEGTYCYFEGDSAAIPDIEALAQCLGMNAVQITKPAKPLYHASAVIACNYFTALMDAALEVAGQAGVDRETMWRSLRPLVAATLKNIDEQGAGQALTGPIVRGDAITVKNHLSALDNHGSTDTIRSIYTALGEQATKIAERSGRTPVDKVEELRRMWVK